MLVIIWLFLCFLVGKFAQKKGYNFWPFALLSAIIISPIGGFIVLLIMGNKKEKNERYASASFMDVPAYKPKPVIQEEYSEIYCPKCGTKVTTEAAFCPQCGESLK